MATSLLSYTSPCLSSHSLDHILLFSPLRLNEEVESLYKDRDYYKGYLHKLGRLAEEYELPHEYLEEFGYHLNVSQYNDFLKHYRLRIKIPAQGSAIPYIIHKINVLTGDSKIIFIKEIIGAIDDYMYMIKHKISYEELQQLRTPCYKPYDSYLTQVVTGLETYYIDLNGQKSGLYERINEEGHVIEKGNYKNDLREGWFEYRRDGRLRTGRYHKDQKQGSWTCYHSNGTLAWSGWYQDNLPHGSWSFYDNEGNLIKEGSYVKGKKEGIWKHDMETEYYLNGVLLKYLS